MYVTRDTNINFWSGRNINAFLKKAYDTFLVCHYCLKSELYQSSRRTYQEWLIRAKQLCTCCLKPPAKCILGLSGKGRHRNGHGYCGWNSSRCAILAPLLPLQKPWLRGSEEGSSKPEKPNTGDFRSWEIIGRFLFLHHQGCSWQEGSQNRIQRSKLNILGTYLSRTPLPWMENVPEGVYC